MFSPKNSKPSVHLCWIRLSGRRVITAVALLFLVSNILCFMQLRTILTKNTELVASSRLTVSREGFLPWAPQNHDSSEPLRPINLASSRTLLSSPFNFESVYSTTESIGATGSAKTQPTARPRPLQGLVSTRTLEPNSAQLPPAIDFSASPSSVSVEAVEPTTLPHSTAASVLPSAPNGEPPLTSPIAPTESAMKEQVEALLRVPPARSWCRDCIDVVIPYVNGSDPWYIRELKKYSAIHNNDVLDYPDAAGPQRYRDSNELLYCLRAVEKYAPWARLIHLLTNGDQMPSWLTREHPKLRIVPHRTLFPPDMHAHLPTFNIFAIKTHLHRIPELAPKFVYVEDDQFFFQPIDRGLFYNFETLTTSHFVERNLPIKEFDQTFPRDNSEWRALRRAALLLHNQFKYSTPLSYPVHGPFFSHRELFREAMQQVWPTEARACSAERSRAHLSFESRVLVPYYQHFRPNRSFDAETFFRTFIDVNSDGRIDHSEARSLAAFLAMDIPDFLQLLNYSLPPNGTIGQWLTLLQSHGSLALKDKLKSAFDYWESTYKNIQYAPIEAMLTQMDNSIDKIIVDMRAVSKKAAETTVHVVGINDNIRCDCPDSIIASREVAIRFLESHYPTPSSFEQDLSFASDYAARVHNAFAEWISRPPTSDAEEKRTKGALLSLYGFRSALPWMEPTLAHPKVAALIAKIHA